VSELDRARERSQAGDHAGASVLLEQACAFAAAADEALLADDPRRALLLAALGGAKETESRALARLAAPALREVAASAASELGARGFHGQAARLLAELGRALDAAHAYAAAGDAVSAAACYERAGRPSDAARALDAALRARPSDAALRLELGELLLRHGRVEAATTTLQPIDATAPERTRAMALLARCFDELGLGEAARDARAELSRRGGDEPPPSAGSPTPHHALGAADALLFGRYEVVREVAVTQSARVLEGIDRVTHERVALKLLREPSEQTMARAWQAARLCFERQAQALEQLHHPSVVPLRAYLPDGPAIVVAWMAGGSLADWMLREVASPARAAEIAVALLGALGEAHRLGILHRELTPSSVLFDEVGAARLADLGAAQLNDEAETVTVGAATALRYLSPEQRAGQAATIASDLYSVGAIVYELLTGEHAEPAEDGALAHAPSAANPDLGAAHDAAVTRLLERDPQQRPADAFEARRSLQALEWPARRRAHAPRPAAPAGRPSPSPSSPSPAKAQRLGAARNPTDGRDATRRQHDTWLDRDVLVLALDAASLRTARAYAQAGHPALPCVLRVDHERGEIWVTAPLGRALADAPGALSPEQLAALREAMDALRDAGGTHGSIDHDHVYLHDGAVALAYPRSAADEATPASDHSALSRLVAG
jgi:serine/threonine-protein kinase